MIDVVREIDATQREVGTGPHAAGEGHVIQLRRTYDAPVEEVWDALTNPERIGRWFLPISGDYRLGGTYQFAGNAGGLTWAGLAVFVVSALMLLLSVENTLNRIWLVKKQRPVLRRLVLYLSILLIGPVLVGSSLWAASYLLTLSSGLAPSRPAWFTHALTFGPLVLATTGFACLFRCVPHAPVRWREGRRTSRSIARRPRAMRKPLGRDQRAASRFPRPASRRSERARSD